MHRRWIYAVVGALVCLTSHPGAADVVSVSDAGFEVGSTLTLKATPKQIFDALGRPDQWWNSEHTYSGSARNLTLRLKAGACFCETVPKSGGTIQHMTVVYAEPHKTVRLSGALGPLQAEGVSGALTWTLKPVSGGTEVVQRYVVGGYLPQGARVMAPLVDSVLSDQLNRLGQHVGAVRH